MRAPSATEPEVVVIESVETVVVEEEKKRPVVLDPGRDLWISTVDGYALLISSPSSKSSVHSRSLCDLRGILF